MLQLSIVVRQPGSWIRSLPPISNHLFSWNGQFEERERQHYDSALSVLMPRRKQDERDESGEERVWSGSEGQDETPH